MKRNRKLACMILNLGGGFVLEEEMGANSEPVNKKRDALSKKKNRPKKKNVTQP